MKINIEINTDDIGSPELDALAALIASLSNRKPGNMSLMEAAGLGKDADRPRVAAVAKVEPTPSRASDLFDAEAARVAALPAAVAPVEKSVELDSKGLPHDVRIHSGARQKNADGTWRTRRGVDPELLASVTASLKLVMAAPVPLVINADGANTAFAEPVADNVSSAAVVVPPPPPPVEPVVAIVAEFPRMMQSVAARQVAGTLSSEMIATVLSQLGLTGMRDLAARPDLIAAFEALLP